MPERPYTDEEKLEYKKLDTFMKNAPKLDKDKYICINSPLESFFNYDEDGNLDQDIIKKDANNYTNIIIDSLNSQLNSSSTDKMSKLIDTIQDEIAILQQEQDYSLVYTKILPKLLYHDELADFYHNAFQNIELADQIIRNIADKDPKIACAIADFYLVGKTLVDVALTYSVEPREIKRWRRKGLVRLLDSDIKKKIIF